jgi:hypothetical protein
MNRTSSDRALTEFLTTRNPFTISKEQPFVPMTDVKARLYDEVTQALAGAMRDDSRAQLRVALDAAFTPPAQRIVRWVS